ncbi:MAG: hypothetical protein EOO72_07295 [Myxococcaceae bacterium]|nr:MAG: hypothetical protein EOO72_07295 [Myxococcaceae bacterium]
MPRLDAPKAPTLECTDPRAQLHEAAKKAGVNVNPEETVTVSKDGLTFTGSSIAGFEQVLAPPCPPPATPRRCEPAGTETLKESYAGRRFGWGWTFRGPAGQQLL